MLTDRTQPDTGLDEDGNLDLSDGVPIIEQETARLDDQIAETGRKALFSVGTLSAPRLPRVLGAH